MNKLGKIDIDGKDYIYYRNAHFKKLVNNAVVLYGFKVAITTLLLIAGAYLIINQQITLGQFIASEIVIILISSSIDKLIACQETVFDAFVSATKIDSVEKYSKMQLEENHNEEYLYAKSGFQSVELQLENAGTSILTVHSGQELIILDTFEPSKINLIKLNGIESRNYSHLFLNDKIQLVYAAQYLINKVVIVNAFNEMLAMDKSKALLTELLSDIIDNEELLKLLTPTNHPISQEELFFKYSLLAVLSKPDVIIFADKLIDSQDGKVLKSIIKSQTNIKSSVEFQYNHLVNSPKI